MMERVNNYIERILAAKRVLKNEYKEIYGAQVLKACRPGYRTCLVRAADQCSLLGSVWANYIWR